jgi:magnesium transporter
VSHSAPETPPEGEYLGSDALTTERFQAVRELVQAQDRAGLKAAFEDRHEADIAELITLLQPDLRRSLIALMGADLAPEVFAEFDDNIRDAALEAVDSDTLAATVQQLDSDDAVFVLEDMDVAERDEVLQRIPTTDRLILQRSLDFPEDSAGRLMQTEFVAVPPFWSVGQTIDYLRDTADLPSDFLELYVTDPTHTPIGVVHLSEILRSQRGVGVGDVKF